MTKRLQNELKKLPDAPGVYLFYNSKKQLIYVGKATSLKDRVKSYFTGSRTLRPIEQMIHQVVNIGWEETDSVLEAIILEGGHIKKYQPKYNVDWKDNKSWNYIVITRDDYPRVETMRQHELDAVNIKDLKKKYSYVFGPYPGLKTRDTMRLLQRLFFISTCKPNAKRACLYKQMGQCLGVCTGDISKTAYRAKVVRPLVNFLKGNKKNVVKALEQEMMVAAHESKFEEAARIRNQIKSLERIRDIALINKSFVQNEIKKSEDQSFGIRVEGYDISNLGISDKVGSMVVFTDGEKDLKEYRKFKIKTVEGQSDVDCLAEVLNRRLKHNEWAIPSLILVDGGKPQVNKTKQILKKNKLSIPVVGIAKGPDRKKNEFILGGRGRNLIVWVNKNKDILIRVRDEAHRFAIKYNRSLRRRRL